MKLQDKLKIMHSEKNALLATNFYNLETCQAVVKAAKAVNKPIILQLTESSINYMGLKTAYKLGRSISEFHQTESWIHLDHCNSFELVRECLKEGFDSVMIDASGESFENNIEITKRVVDLALKYNANVEAELGYVPKPELDLDEQKFTVPEEANKFVGETGINALAVAIGSKHGFYKGRPKLDIERLQEIKKVVETPLVLHGGSGIPNEMLKSAIKSGITKVNIATEIKNLFMKSLKNLLRESEEIDLRKIFPKAIENVTDLIIEKFKVVSFN